METITAPGTSARNAAAAITRLQHTRVPKTAPAARPNATSGLRALLTRGRARITCGCSAR